MKMQFGLLLGLLLTSSAVHAKCLIFTYSYDSAEFIEMQQKTFKKFIEDEYEFIVFSDAPTEAIHAKIVTVCAQYNITCIRIPQHIHEPPYYVPLTMPEIYTNRIAPSAVRHVHAIQYSMDHYGFKHDDIVWLVDGDMFLVRPINIGKFMKGCDIAAVMRGGDNGRGQSVSYCWPAVTFLNMKTLPDKTTMSFNNGWVNGCSADTGGATHYYLKAHPELCIKQIFDLWGGELGCPDRLYKPMPHLLQLPIDRKIALWKSKGFNEKEINFLVKQPDTIEFVTEGEQCWLLHFRGGSNYEKLSPGYMQNKRRLINTYLDGILELV